MSNFPWGSAICLKSFGFLIPQPSIGGLCPELVLHWWREGPGGSQLCGPSCTTPLHQIPPPQIPSRLLFHINNQAAWNSFEQVISPAKPLCSRLISKWSTSGNFLMTPPRSSMAFLFWVSRAVPVPSTQRAERHQSAEQRQTVGAMK